MRFIDQDVRVEVRQEAAEETEHETQRAMWYFSVDMLAQRYCPNFGSGHQHIDAYHGEMQCPASVIEQRLTDAIDDVPDLGILIRKAGVDRDSFIEGQMTPAERYRL